MRSFPSKTKHRLGSEQMETSYYYSSQPPGRSQSKLVAPYPHPCMVPFHAEYCCVTNGTRMGQHVRALSPGHERRSSIGLFSASASVSSISCSGELPGHRVTQEAVERGPCGEKQTFQPCEPALWEADPPVSLSFQLTAVSANMRLQLHQTP